MVLYRSTSLSSTMVAAASSSSSSSATAKSSASAAATGGVVAGMAAQRPPRPPVRSKSVNFREMQMQLESNICESKKESSRGWNLFFKSERAVHIIPLILLAALLLLYIFSTRVSWIASNKNNDLNSKDVVLPHLTRRRLQEAFDNDENNFNTHHYHEQQQQQQRYQQHKQKLQLQLRLSPRRLRLRFPNKSGGTKL